jgi:DNA-binding beta-propeller fold protein YncE
VLISAYSTPLSRRELLVCAASTAFALRTGTVFAASAPRSEALVTCDIEARIAVVDLAAGRVVGSIPVPAGPRSLERVGTGLALACHTVVGAVTILDGQSREVRHVLHDFIEPRYAARHPDGVHAFVTDSGRELVASVDVLSGRVLGVANLRGWARHLSLSPDARTLWVGLGNVAEHIAIVDVSDPGRPAFVRNISPPFLAHDVAFFPDGRHVWVTAGEAETTALYDRSGRLLVRLPADAGPQHVAFGAVAAYVTSGVAGTLYAQSLRDGSVVGRTRIPVGSYNVQSGPGGLVLSPSLNHGTLCVLNRRGHLIREVHVASSSHDACFVF